MELVTAPRLPWIRGLLEAYGPWSAQLNGTGSEQDAEFSRTPDEWNDVYYSLLAYSLEGMAPDQIDRLALDPIVGLPDQTYFNVVTDFLRAVDVAFFNREELSQEGPRIRQALAERLMAARGWQRLSYDPTSTSVEMRLGPAMATMFFNDHGFGQPPKCYLFEKAVARCGPFLPTLQALIQNRQSYFLALLVLNFLEVAPTTEHLPLGLQTARSLMATYGIEIAFWVDHGWGRRFSFWIDKLLSIAPEQFANGTTTRQEVETLLAFLVRAGVAEARQLEAKLAEVP